MLDSDGILWYYAYMDDEFQMSIRAQIEITERKLELLRALLNDSENKVVVQRKKSRSRARGPQPKFGSIMEAVLEILESEESGLTAKDILMRLNQSKFPELLRTSLSPQLSRLKQRGYLEYGKKLWRITDDQLPLPYVIENNE